MCEAYINAYGNLFYGEIDIAIMILTDTKSIAARMVKKSDVLVKIYDGLTDYTNAVLKEVMNERSADEKKRSETKSLLNELDGSVKTMEELKENLKKEIEQYDANYKQLQEREMKQEEHAYDMQLASMIIGAVVLVMQDDGNLVTYDKNKEPLWASDTYTYANVPGICFVRNENTSMLS